MLRTATAIAALLLVSSPALAQEDWGAFYAKVFGGVTAPESNLAWGAATYPIDAGWIGGVAIGLATPIEGLSVEIDATTASALYTGFTTSYAPTTVMGNVVFTLPVVEQFDIYGGVGVGAVHLRYVAPAAADAASGVGLGGQAFAGVNFNVTENVALFTEVRYQASSPIRVTDGGTYGSYNMDYRHTSVLAGLKFSTE